MGIVSECRSVGVPRISFRGSPVHRLADSPTHFRLAPVAPQHQIGSRIDSNRAFSSNLWAIGVRATDAKEVGVEETPLKKRSAAQTREW